MEHIEGAEGPRPAWPAGTRSLPPPVHRLAEHAFHGLASVRRARALHPRGMTFTGRATVDPEAALSAGAEVDVVVRLSRGAGLPTPLPDVHGVAVRFADAHGPGRHQDLLLSSAFGPPLLRHVLRPARRFDSGCYTTVLAYRRRSGGRSVFRSDAVPVPTLDGAASRLPWPVVLREASLLGGWRPVAELRLTDVLDDDAVRFDPWNTSDELIPAGLLNALRAPAYEGSRRGTRTPGDAGPAGSRSVR